MATREENIKKINEKLEGLSDEQLEQVVGGFATVYFFLCTKIGDKYAYTKDPVALGIFTSPFDFMKENVNFFADAANKNLIEFSDTKPTKKFQDFANDNASRWDKPARWGNLVYAVDPLAMSVDRYEA